MYIKESVTDIMKHPVYIEWSQQLLYILIWKVVIHINRDFNSHSWIRTLGLIVHIDLERQI